MGGVEGRRELNLGGGRRSKIHTQLGQAKRFIGEFRRVQDEM